MATQVIIKFLKKRPGSARALGKQNSFPSPDEEAQLRRNQKEQEDAEAEADITTPKLSREERAAGIIQSAWRGHVIRKELRFIMFDSQLSGNAIQLALDFVLDWHAGWKKLYVVLFLLLFFLFTVYVQTFAAFPSANAVDLAFLKLAGSEQLQEARDAVKKSSDLYALMHAWIDLTPPALESSEHCKEIWGMVCPSNATKQEEAYAGRNITLWDDLLASCEDVSPNSGFVDSTNRMYGTMYVYQTRRKTEQCKPEMQRMAPYAGVSRPCLSEQLDTTGFTPYPEDCVDCSAFDFLPEYGFFVHALTGDVFNLPSEFMHCRVNELERNAWLDYKTRDLCFMATLVDINHDGRIMAYLECFTFLAGGEVTSGRQVVSQSFLASGYADCIALTILSLFFTVAHQFAVFVKASAQKWRTIAFWLRLLAPAFEIAANAMFLSFLVVIVDFEFSTRVTRLAFFEETYSFLEDALRSFEMARYWFTYTVIASLALMFRLLDTLRHLDFHPSSAIVGGVLQSSAKNLISFAFVFFLLVLVYAFIGLLLFSRTTTLFSTYGKAVNTLLLIATGETEVFVAETVASVINPQSLVQIHTLYFWVYVFIVSILLFNVLLAIIVGAYVDMTDVSKHGGAMLSFTQSMLETLRFFAISAQVRITRRLCKRGGKTPVEKLLGIRQRYRLVGCSAMHLREELSQVFFSTRVVEQIVARCRAQTKHERLKNQVLYLRGIDSESEVLKGHNMAVLEAIDRKVSQLLALEHRKRGMGGGTSVFPFMPPAPPPANASVGSSTVLNG